MKARRFSFCACLFVIFLGCATSQAQVSGVPESPPPHPRLFLLRGEERSIKDAMSSDNALAAAHQVILAECERLIATSPVQRTLVGRRLLNVSREALRRIFFLSYAYRMTGDSRYAERAERELLAIAQFSDWHPGEFLDVAELTTAAAVGYDWLNEALTPTTRDVLREAIRRLGIEPSLNPKYSYWLKVGNNWNQVCSAGIALGALAIYEDDSAFAMSIIRRSAEALRIPMAEYEPDGAYPEGYGYWGYGTTYNVLFLDAIKKALGTDFGLPLNGGFSRTAGFLLNMIGPSGLPFNFSDAGTAGELNPAMFWFASRLNDPSLLFMETRFLTDPKKLVRNRFLPSLLLWGATARLPEVREPASTVWVGGGRTPVALLRSGWDANAFYVTLKGGSASTNHAHMDIGSFVMDWGGTRWAIDFGMQDYYSLESKGVDLWNMKQSSQRWQVFRYSNLAHNTLAVDGALQRVSGRAEITAWSANPRFSFAKTDLSSVYANQLLEARRGVAIVNARYVAVRDELVTLNHPTKLRWTMATSASLSLNPDGSALLTKDGRRLLVRAIEPKGVSFTTWSTTPPHDYDAPNPGTALLGFEIELPPNSPAALSVVLSPDNLTPRPDSVPALAEWN